jgi:hypothetical protein
VASAFIGAAPSEEHSVDHIAKYDGDFIKERSDNRASNLRYANRKQQRANQKASSVRIDARAILIWKGDDKSSALRFDSCARAARHIGVSEANLGRVARKQRKTIGGYKAEFVQDAMSSSHDDEEFRTVHGLKVSQYGRVVLQHGRAVTPTPRQDGYSFVEHNGSTTSVHRLVADAWPDIVGEMPTDTSLGYTLDHKDRDTTNNSATNLRWVTKDVQIQNQNRQHCSQIMSAMKIPMQIRPSGGDWISFDSVSDAARFMSTRLGRTIKNSTLCRAIKESPLGYTFKKRNACGWAARVQRRLNSSSTNESLATTADSCDSFVSL